MGLMKIATYHKMLGDYVEFFKGEFKDFVIEDLYQELLQILIENDRLVSWREYKTEIINFIKKGTKKNYEIISALSESKLVAENIKYYRDHYRKKEYFNNPKWDRIYISTLFTFHWKKTIETINYFKLLCKSLNEVKVGGVAATLLPVEFEQETGIIPHKGLLNQAGIYDDNEIIIDNLPLDYSILNEINYVYPENEGYYGYMTRGCVRRCKFCAVPQLEPKYNCFISIKDQIDYVRDKYGEKRNLLLLDNNVLASERFDEIINEIKACGFYKDATFIEPNVYEITIKDLRNLKLNYKGHLKKITSLYKWLYKKVSIEEKSKIYEILATNYLLEADTATKEKILSTYNFFSPLFGKYHNTIKKLRYVDFNQGVDSRFVTPEKMKKLSEIPIRPLRIAFDSWKFKDSYERSIRLAAENGIIHMSNYLLYNYSEDPVDLYKRLKLNIDLCEELGIKIYSFPMKYHPIQESEYFDNRNYIGEKWSRKFIRTIQAILNSTKGKVGTGKAFFEEAFGRDEIEFEKLLYMPESLIIYRNYFKENGITEDWYEKFIALDYIRKEKVKKIIEKNDFANIEKYKDEKDIFRILKYYTITKDNYKKIITVTDNFQEN